MVMSISKFFMHQQIFHFNLMSLDKFLRNLQYHHHDKQSVLFITLFICRIILCRSPNHNRNVVDKNVSGYLSRTGEPVAVTHLIQEYELDHLALYKREIIGDNYLEWKDLENKNLNDYCRKYLHQSVPGRRTWKATGTKQNMKLRYATSGYESLNISNIVAVKCEYQLQISIMRHYLTRAPEPNCVYALKRAKGRGKLLQMVILTIMNKHCNFEQCNYSRPKEEIKGIHIKCTGEQWHSNTGQRIAFKNAINEYELQHQELHKKEADEYNCIHWSYVVKHSNLNDYCCKYLSVCCPYRNTNNVVGNWSFQNLQWRSNKEKSARIVVVKCYVPGGSKRNYYFTRALDTDCVYALLHTGRCKEDPFQIIFRYCYFNNPNIKQEILENNDVVSKTEHCKKIKIEDPSILKTLQLFPNN